MSKIKVDDWVACDDKRGSIFLASLEWPAQVYAVTGQMVGFDGVENWYPMSMFRVVDTPPPGPVKQPKFDRTVAAISLRVPMSGNDELDAMIRQSRRLDFAQAAMHALAETSDGLRMLNGEPEWPLQLNLAEAGFLIADAMLAKAEQQ